MSDADYVVIGGGIAGVSCVQTLRLLSEDVVRIVLITSTEVVNGIIRIIDWTSRSTSRWPIRWSRP